MDAQKELERRRAEKWGKWPNYKKYADIEYHWWKKEDKPKIPDFSGKPNSYFKWPCLVPTGRGIPHVMDYNERLKVINNAWRNCFFMQYYVLTEELGEDKAQEMIGYMWLAMAQGQTEGQIIRYGFQDEPRDCELAAKLWLIDYPVECHDMDAVLVTPKKCILDVKCTYYVDWKWRWEQKGVNIRKGLCDLGCEAWDEEWAYKINPKMSSTRTKWMVDGDPVCRYEFELHD